MPAAMGPSRRNCFIASLVFVSMVFGQNSVALAQTQRSPRAQGARGVSTVAAKNPLPLTVTCGSGTNNWTGTAGDNQWTTASNWSTGAVPVSTDSVCIPSSFTTAITIGTLAATNQTISSLDSGAPLSFTTGPLTITGSATFAANLAVSGGTLTLNGTSSMTTLAQSTGTLSGTGTLTVSGLMTWSGGTQSGSAVTNANGGMALSGEPFLDTRTMNNSGTATWTGEAFLMLNGSIFNNNSGSTWNHQGDTGIQFEGGTTPTFNNSGTFEKTSGTSSNGGGVGGSIVFNNTGSVLASSGILFVNNNGSCSGACAGSWSVPSGDTLQLGSGSTAALSGPISGAGTVTFTTGTVNYTGTYNVTGGTTVTEGTANFNSGATPTSVGPLTISGGTLNFSTGKAITTTTVTQSTGTLTGTDNLTVSGLMTWSGGTQSGSAVTNANGGMALSGEPFLDTRTMNNAKTATWTGEAFLMLNGSIFNNNTGATWNHEGDTNIQFEGGTSPTFNNSGTFEKTSGTNSNGGGVGGSIVFNNTGSVLANSGILLVNDNGSCTGTCAGTWSVASGATLQLGSGATAALSGPISGAGTVSFTTGTVNYTGTYNVTGGTTVTEGTANFNSGTTPTSVGPLTISGGTLNFSTGKAIKTTELTQSTGTLTGSDTLTVSKTVTWSGGTESGSGITNAEGGMTLSGEPFLQTRTMNNTKTAAWTGEAFLMLDGAVFNNKAGATWNHEGDTNIQFEGGTNPTFNNAGTFEKTSGTSVNGGGVSSSVVFNNTGTVLAKSGILLLGNLFTQTKGSVELDGGNVSVPSGTLTATGGSVLGIGTITGGVTNTGGTVSPTLTQSKPTTGTLAINGSGEGYYTQGSGGTLLLDLAGSSKFDVLSATGAASLAGSLQLCLTNGFKPAAGATFPVVTYASETGTFPTVNFGWSVTYNSTSAVAKYSGAPVDVFSPTSLAFPSQLISTTSPSQTLTLTNEGTVAMTINSITITGSNSSDYALASGGTCGSSLAAGAKCTIMVTFTPSALGARTADVMVTDNACLSPQLVPLTGKGTEITMSPSPVNFGNQATGTTSSPMTVTLTNHGTTAVKVTKASISGTDKADFKITSNGCTTIAASGGTCTIDITFTPGASGSRTGTLSVTDNDKGSPQTDTLEGTGT
jgi:fibronectin-binding autotransporter adhesin